MSSSWAAHLGPPVGGGWTDADVIVAGVHMRADILAWIALSGLLAFGYNILTTYFAVKLSATTASFVGNLPTSTLVSLLLLEKKRPQGRWAVLLWSSVFGNVAAFAAYNAFRRRRLAKRSKDVASS